MTPLRPMTHKRSALYMLAHDEWCSHDEADDGIECDCHLSVIASSRKQLGAEIRLRDKSEANESRLQVESADLRTRLEAAEKELAGIALVSRGPHHLMMFDWVGKLRFIHNKAKNAVAALAGEE